MENESLPKAMPEQLQEALDQHDQELVRRTSRNAEKLAIALGLPREAKYDVLAALGGRAVEAVTNLKETYRAEARSAPSADHPGTEGA